ncbi:MAG: hypothetical protein EZS28_010678, partial [Streblomastix strix]
HLYVDADKDEKQKNQQNSINSIYIGYQSCDIEDGTSECPYGSITDAIYAGLQNEGKQDLTVTLQTSIFENVMLDKQIAMNIHNLKIEGEQQIKQGKVMLQNTDKGANIPVLIVDAQSEKNDSRIYISIELSNILICFNQFVKDPSYSSQAPFNPPNLIHIISLGYQEDKLKFRLNECDLRGRGTGVYNSLLCIEQGDVEISNSTFKSIFYKEEFDGQILIPSIFAQSAAVDFGYKCGNVIINDSFFTNLYMLTHQQIKDGSTEDSIGVALTIRRNRNPKSFVVIRNTIFDRCWDVTQQQKGSPTSTIVILMNESQGSNSDFGNINLIDCNFIQCRGRRSGAVYLHSMDQLTSESWPDNDPTPSQYANAIEVFGCESELELNSVSLWAEAQGYEGNYWMNSYINVNDASLIISNSEMLNMTCLNTPISVNGQGKLLVTDTIFANLYRLSQGNIGGSGNGADAGAVSLTGQLKPNQNEYLTSVTNCTFISCQGQRAGVIEVHQGIRLRYVNSSIFRKDCEAVGNSYQQEKAQFIFFFQFDVAKEDLVTHTVFNGNQFEKNGYQLPAKMESFDADLSSETLTIEDLTIKDLIDEIDDINVNILIKENQNSKKKLNLYSRSKGCYLRI